MNAHPHKVVRLAEYRPISLHADALAVDDALLIWERYRTQIEIVEPSFRTENRWQLKSQGWVGQIPLNDSLVLSLEPKTPIRNLFGMLEYAYNLKSMQFLPDLVQNDSLQEFYEQLASVLAKRVLARSRKGLYRSYRLEEERLPYIRGRVDLAQSSMRIWDPHIHCQFEEHNADVDENRILAWTLWRIINSGYCTERVLPTVRRAFRVLQSAASVEPYTSLDCVGRIYNRLNQDYQTLHALSRFFLDRIGPSHLVGQREMTPFLVDMAQLYEMFVAEWLRAHAPHNWRIESQVRLPFGIEHQRHFRPDIVVRDVESDRVLFVLDTKYKVTEQPSDSDIMQMITYAHLMNCQTAVLLYPELPYRAETYHMRGINVHSMCFALDGDLEISGIRFLESLVLALAIDSA